MYFNTPVSKKLRIVSEGQIIVKWIGYQTLIGNSLYWEDI